MKTIIANVIAVCNKYFTQTPAYTLTSQLTPFQHQLLKIYYDDWLLGITKSKRSVKSFALRFNKSEDHISLMLSDMEAKGVLESLPHGSGIKPRWISCAAFIELEDYNKGQISDQTESIPYIDLSEEEVINIEILNQAQSCGQNLQEIQDSDLKLDLLLVKQRVPMKDRIQIKKSLITSRIGPGRRENIINRVVAATIKKPLQNAKLYFNKCIQREKEEINQIKNILYDKPHCLNLYAIP